MGEPEIMKAIVYVARFLEIVGVAVIALAFFHALARAALHFGRQRKDAYVRLRVYLGKALLLGLEFLVAADIVRTVLIQTTVQSIASLGLLVVVRIVLGWSIAVEIEGCWPWQIAGRTGAAGGERLPATY